MKRLACLLIVFAALAFAVAGCRRVNPDKKQPPVNVAESSDFIIPPSIEDTGSAFLKKPKKEAPRGDESKAEKDARLANEEREAKERQQKAKDGRAQILKNIGKTYLNYLTSGTASKLSIEDFKLRLRRAGLNKERKAVEGKEFDVVMDADLTYPEHVLAYRVAADNGLYEAVLVNQTIDAISDRDLPGRLMKQTLQSVYARYKAYSMQAQQKSFEEFKTYLKDQAQPALASAIASQNIKVNVAAQVGNNGHLVACFAKMIENSGFGKDLPGIMGNGEIRGLTPAFVQTVFQGN